MGAPAWAMPEAGEQYTKQDPIKRHTTMGTLPWAHLHGRCLEAEERHTIMGALPWAHHHGSTEQHPTKQHTIMGAPAWVMPEAGERYTKQHPIMGTPAWDELQYSAIIL